MFLINHVLDNVQLGKLNNSNEKIDFIVYVAIFFWEKGLQLEKENKTYIATKYLFKVLQNIIYIVK